MNACGVEHMKVILLMALTVDGKIGRNSDHFPDWTSTEDKQMFKAVTQKAGAVIMGSRTFDTIGKPLSGRKNIVLTRNKDRISQWENLTFTDRLPRDIVAELKNDGFAEVVLAGGATINTLFAAAGLIDEIHVTFAPVIFGTGLSLFSERMSMVLELMDMRQLGDNQILAKYQVIQTATP